MPSRLPHAQDRPCCRGNVAEVIVHDSSRRELSIIENVLDARSEFCNILNHPPCSRCDESLGSVVPPADTDRPQLCRACHFHIKSRVADKSRILSFRAGSLKRLKKHAWVGLRGCHVGRLNRPKKVSPAQRVQRGSNGGQRVSGCDSEHNARRKAQIGKQSAYSIERHLGKRSIGPQQGEHTAICHDHLGNRCARASELGQDKLKRFPDQRKTFFLRRQRQPEFSKNGAMTLKDQCAAIDECPVKVEDNELHSIISSTQIVALRSTGSPAASAQDPSYAPTVQRFSAIRIVQRISAKVGNNPAAQPSS
jgi:hypothetical protein